MSRPAAGADGRVNGLTAVSLFAGIGGFDLALERSGADVVAAVEIDRECRGVLARHFPHTTLFGDVTEVTGDQLRAAGFVPGRGILAAGWPCQGNSVAGRGKGMADSRSGLWRHVVRLVAETRPRWFVGENVPGLLSVNNGQDFGTVISDLDELGYGVAWRVLDAQWFGVPQRRRRVFIAGCLGDPAGPVQVLLEPESGDGNLAAGRAARPGTAGAPGGGSVATLQGGGRRGHRVDAEGAAGGHLIAFDAAQITSGENRVNPQPGDPNPPLVATGQPMVAHALTSEGADASEDGAGRGRPLVTVPMAFNPQTGGSKARLGYGDKPTALQANQVTAVHMATDWQGGSNQDQIIGPGATSPTLAHSSAAHSGHHEPKVLTASAVRRLTPTECERLQGFPDDWTRLNADGRQQSDSARYRQLGNAVAVPVVEWITGRIAAVEARAGHMTTEGAA